ncbi:hypothetical protein D3C73_1406810 [compost metagenome]
MPLKVKGLQQFSQCPLVNGAGMQISSLLGFGDHPDQFRGADDPAGAHSRSNNLGEGSCVDHTGFAFAASVNRCQRRGISAWGFIEGDFAIRIVFENEHIIAPA